MKRILPLLLVLVSFQLSAQRLENIRAEAINGGEKIVITYDLIGGSADQKFKVAIYGSHNNYLAPLLLVSGDVGEVVPGKGKRVEWNSKNEITEYNGDITFEVRADPVAVVVQQLQINTPRGGSKGKSMNISWAGGKPNDVVKLELMQNGLVVTPIGSGANTNSYTWKVPSDIDKASNYQLRISTTDGSSSTSGTFTIKKKLSPLVYILPAAALVGVAAVVGGGAGSSPDLPLPPDPANP